MAEQNLGFIALNSRREIRSRFSSSLGLTQQDTYAFSTGPVQANVGISGDFFQSPVSVSPGLALFRDNNANRKLDNGDTFLPPGANGNRFVVLNRALSGGNYIARVNALVFSDLPYTFTIHRDSSGSANPLTAPEIPLGTIAQDLQRRDSVSDKDTADNFAFTLDGASSLNIGVRELGNKRGDVNIRVVRDLNSNGTVDANEVVVKGTSKTNLDTITNLRGAGDYVLQVCQSKGSTQFEVNFDHSPV